MSDGEREHHVMRSISTFRTFVFSLIAGLWLTGCLPTSENPIVKGGQDVIDERLIGSWFGQLEDGDELLYMHIFAAEEDEDASHPGGMRVILVSHPQRKTADGGWAVLYGLSARNDERGVLSLLFEDDSGEPVDESLVGWHLYGYAFDAQNQLEIKPMDEDNLVEFIEDGKLPGTAEKTRFFSETRITASSDALVKLFESADWDYLLSDEPGRFVKQNAVPPTFD